MIDKDSPIPIYYQLEQGIRSMITDGTLKTNDLIPSERELSERFRISRMTVRQAISALVQDQILIKNRGKGTFVAAKKIEKGPSIYSFTEEMRKRSLTPSSKVLSMKTITPNESVQERLGINSNEDVYEIRRLRLADGEPLAIETSFVPRRYAPDLCEKDLVGSLYEILRKHLAQVTGMERTVESTLPTPEESKLLGIRTNLPVLLVVGRAFSQQNTVEYAKSVYRGDRYKFSVQFHEDGNVKS